MPSTPKPVENADQFGTADPPAEIDFPREPGLSGPAYAYAESLIEACELGEHAGTNWMPPRLDRIHPAAEWARSGAMELTGPRDGAARFAPGPVASVMSGVASVIESLAPSLYPGLEAAHPGLEAAHPGLAAALHDPPALLGERAAIFGLTRQGAQSAGGSARILPTRTISLALNLPREDDWHLVPAWLEASSDLTRRLQSSEDAVKWSAVETAILDLDAQTLIDRGHLMGLAIAPATPAASQAKTSLSQTPFFRLTQGSESERRDPHPDSSGRPLRLLDLSTLWAGPLATSLLANVGIDVLKVESPNRPDGARQGPKAFFDLMNGAKRGCALDLREPTDRATFERLLSAADIVVESARPRALAQLGYDAESWVTERPGRLWTSITGYGRNHEWIAFGDDAAAAAGLAFSPDPTEGDPCFCADAIADPLTGLHAAALLLAQLRLGRGGLLDLSLRDIAHCAALAEHDGLTLPIESRAGDAWVAAPTGLVGIAAPRARMPEGEAPALLPPAESLLDEWTC